MNKKMALPVPVFEGTLLIVLHQLLSILWYSPWMFGYKWLRLTGLSPAELDSAKFSPFVISILASTALVYGMAWLFGRLKVKGIGQGVKYAIFFWAVFLLMLSLTHAAFEHIPPVLVLIDLGRDFMIFTLTGGMLGLYFRPQRV